jgi:hypothetical protein
MALTNFTLTDQDVGRDLGMPDGYLVSLSMTAPPAPYITPEWDESRLCWKSGCFVLRGSLAFRDSVCVSPQTNGAAMT